MKSLKAGAQRKALVLAASGLRLEYFDRELRHRCILADAKEQSLVEP